MSMEGAEGAAIEVAGLGRDFGERTALRDVTFEVRRGEALTIVGPNGAGKSTLLRILATLLRPHRGSVSVLGARLPDEAWRARGRIGLLGHETLLYRDLTVEENLRFHARLHGVRGDGAERIESLLDTTAMTHRGGDRVGELSRGMAQRVAACRAVLHEPELLLLDEPMSHLDPRGHTLIGPLISESGRTRVSVTHDLAGDLGAATRVLALDTRGSVFHDGPPDALDRERLGALYSGTGR